MANIISYGAYIPKYRVKVADIARVWKKNAEEIVGGLGVQEKAVPNVDEDAVTLAYEAASQCIAASGTDKKHIGALFIGSESHPYAVNPSSTIVGEFLGIPHGYLASDMEFACKAGTAGMQAVMGLVESGHIEMGMAIGADTAQGKPHDVLEYASGAAGASYLIGRSDGIAECIAYTSYSSDTPDFWRRDGMRYPSHAGRFTGEPAYFAHVMGAADALLKQTNKKPSDIDYCVFHMPNGKFPREVAKRLGFTSEQLFPSLTVDMIGNPYSASSLLGLAATLDVASPNKTIFMVSYGSGAGSDAFLFQTTKKITALQKKRKEMHVLVSEMIKQCTPVSYVEYLKKTHTL